MKKCDFCKKDLTALNTADGVNGFEIRERIKEAPQATRTFEACKSCYPKEHKKIQEHNKSF